MKRMCRWLLILAGVGLIAMTQLAHAAAVASQPAASSSAAPAEAPTAAQPSLDESLYALGVLLSHNLETFGLSEQEFKRVLAGFSDGYHDRAHVDPQAYIPQLRALQASRQQALADHQKQVGAAYVARVAALPGARKTPSGLVYVPSVEGSGPAPAATDSVKVQYTGKLTNGTVFDSSYKRGQPASFPLRGIIPCWREALQLMKVGGKARVVCPAQLAYGDRGSPPVIPPGATLDFQIELLEVTPTSAPPRPPGTFAPPPPSAPR
jgi:FKBP-type peptidyl-prolyl cis-trans isomerase FkpA